MFGLPQSTELNRQIPKKSVFDKFKMNKEDKAKFEEDINKLSIVGEVSPRAINIAIGENVTAFYVVIVSLRTREYDQKNIIKLLKLIDQNMLLILGYESMARLAVYRSKLMQSEWIPLQELTIKLIGLNLDAVWENIIVQVGNIEVEQGNTLDEQLLIDVERAKLQHKIEQLEREARREKQPRKKFELAQEAKRLKKLEANDES